MFFFILPFSFTISCRMFWLIVDGTLPQFVGHPLFKDLSLTLALVKTMRQGTQLLWYFINEILLTTDKNKIQSHPSIFVHHFVFFVAEISFTLFMAFYLLPQSLQYSLNYSVFLEIFVAYILVTIIIILCIDTFGIISGAIIYDLSQSFYHDCYNKSSQFEEDYIFYSKIFAYDKFTLYDNSKCMICHGNYMDDDMNYDKQLLQCGHMYHKHCLQQNEQYQWNNNLYEYGLSQCAHCRNGYDADTQKYDYDENYWSTLPSYLRTFEIFGEEATEILYWGPINEQYVKHAEQKLPNRPRYLMRNINCVKAVILNICHLGIKFVSQCVQTTSKLIVSIVSEIQHILISSRARMT